MRINPDQPDLLILSPVKLGHPSHRARSDRVVAPQNDRNFTRLQSFDDLFGVLGAGCSDLFQIFGVRMPFLLLLSNRHGNIATILHDMPEGL